VYKRHQDIHLVSLGLLTTLNVERKSDVKGEFIPVEKGGQCIGIAARVGVNEQYGKDVGWPGTYIAKESLG
jgi:hypothetical protein